MAQRRLVDWPGEPHAAFERLQDMAAGDPCTVTRLTTVACLSA